MVREKTEAPTSSNKQREDIYDGRETFINNFTAGFPVYSVEYSAATSTLFVAGGGGPTKSGVRNSIISLKYSAKTGKVSVISEISSGREAPTSMALHPKQPQYLVCGVNDRCWLVEREERDRYAVAPARRLISFARLALIKSIRTDFGTVDSYQKLVRFSPFGREMLTVGSENKVRFWSFPDLKAISELIPPDFTESSKDRIEDCDYDPEGLFVAVMTPTGCHIQSREEQKFVALIAPKNGYMFRCVRYVGRGASRAPGLVTVENCKGRRRPIISYWNTTNWTRKYSAILRTDARVVTLAISENDNFIAYGTTDGSIGVLDRDFNKLLVRSNAHNFVVTSVVVTDYGTERLLISGSGDGTGPVLCISIRGPGRIPSAATYADMGDNGSSTLSFETETMLGPGASQAQSETDFIESLSRRLISGGGEFLFRLGCDDDGTCLGHDQKTIELKLAEYRDAAERLDAILLPQQHGRIRHCGRHGSDCYGGWYLIRLNPKSIETIPEVRVSVVGNVDAGKSTMLGVLTSGVLDDGRGRSRVGLFRHKHEIESGRTSSIGQEILAFDASGNVICRSQASGSAKSATARRVALDEICPGAHKVITFMDLAGHERYLKTTMFGLTGGAPDYVMLMVGANAGLIGMAKEHLTLAFALSTPVMVIITKVDMSPANILEETIRQVQKVLKSPSSRRAPVMVKDEQDVLLCIQNFVSQRLCPIFQISNVTGQGLDLLRMFLHLLQVGGNYGPIDAPAEFQITESYLVAGVGTVIAGTMIAGKIALGQTLYLGPDSTGAFIPVQIKGVQRKRITVNSVYAGQCASFALKKIKRTAIRKGMILVGKELAINPPITAKACREFEAEVVILFHSTTIGPRYQAMLHCGVVRQTATLIKMQNDILRTGDRAIVRFRFLRYPEYLKVGDRLLFREGRAKGVGRITALLD